MRTINVNTASASYNVTVGGGLLARAGELLSLKRRVMIITDSGVPSEYAKAVGAQAIAPEIFTIPEGEHSKSLAFYEKILSRMLELGFTRSDCVVAVGGGVVGDLSGFVAASYMRGIDFYNIPTTLLSQVDSSIGGKVAVNFCDVKNIIGSFYQPKAVLADTDTLKTLPPRQFSNGMAEIIKMALTFDKPLFELIEHNPLPNADTLESIIAASLQIKANVVAEDEKETGIRKMLNFGHTIGHGIESADNLSGLYHGECVALGILPMTKKSLRERVAKCLGAAGLPTELPCELNTLPDKGEKRIFDAVAHDKKAASDGEITVCLLNEIGRGELKKESIPSLKSRFAEVFVK